MTKCDETLRTIDLHSTGLASLSEIDQDHLKNCSDCATEFWRSDSFRRALEEYSHDLERQSDGIEAQILSRLDSGELPKGDETPSSAFRIRWPQIATFAAALFLVTLTFWQLLPPAARLRVKASQARHRNLIVQLESQLLSQQAQAATIEADYKRARLTADLNAELQSEGLIDDLTDRLSKINAENLATRLELENKRLKIAEKSNQAQLEASTADMATLQALYELRVSQLDALKVRPGIGGQLQEVTVEVGQQVAPGTNLARVARPDMLMAELRIAETQANEVRVGQRADIDTRQSMGLDFLGQKDLLDAFELNQCGPLFAHSTCSL